MGLPGRAQASGPNPPQSCRGLQLYPAARSLRWSQQQDLPHRDPESPGTQCVLNHQDRTRCPKARLGAPGGRSVRGPACARRGRGCSPWQGPSREAGVPHFPLLTPSGGSEPGLQEKAGRLRLAKPLPGASPQTPAWQDRAHTGPRGETPLAAETESGSQLEAQVSQGNSRHPQGLL